MAGHNKSYLKIRPVAISIVCNRLDDTASVPKEAMLDWDQFSNFMS